MDPEAFEPSPNTLEFRFGNADLAAENANGPGTPRPFAKAVKSDPVKVTTSLLKRSRPLIKLP
jgi:hypothetical protein